jgi:hypothetical protein
MALPGCTHCLWQNGDIRTLQGLSDAEAEAKVDINLINEDQLQAFEYYYHHGRVLYTKILPDFSGIDDYDTDEGFCANGFGHSACPLDISAAGQIKSMWLLLFSCLCLCLIVNF